MRRNPQDFVPHTAVKDTIAEEWVDYRGARLPDVLSPEQLSFLNQSFYAGAMATLMMILEMSHVAERTGGPVPRRLTARYERWYKDLLQYSMVQAEFEAISLARRARRSRALREDLEGIGGDGDGR